MMESFIIRKKRIKRQEEESAINNGIEGEEPRICMANKKIDTGKTHHPQG